MQILPLLERFGEGLDVAGVLVIVVGAAVVSILFLKDWLDHRRSAVDDYTHYRQNLGRVILLGLEFLIAGDIVRTVAGTPTFTSIGILGLIVLIRTFLGMTFELEVNGRWPWQRRGSQN